MMTFLFSFFTLLTWKIFLKILKRFPFAVYSGVAIDQVDQFWRQMSGFKYRLHWLQAV